MSIFTNGIYTWRYDIIGIYFKRKVNIMDKGDLQAIRELLHEELHRELNPIKQDISSLKGEVTSIKGELIPIKQDISSLKSEVVTIKSQLSENTQILKALEHSAEIAKAERDNMNNDIYHIKGHIKNIDENLNSIKEIIGRHEVDITTLKRRPV